MTDVWDVCGGCGIVAPTKVRACEYCGAAFPDRRVAVSRPGGGWGWGSLRGIVGCEGCGLSFPLDAVMPEGPVECPHCGTPRGLNVAWPVAFEDAHDRARVRPAGAAGIGITKIGTTRPFLINSRTAMSMSPGHPLCASCRAPLTGGLEGSHTTTVCGACGDQGRYLPPEGARALYPRLRGIVGLRHRVDHPQSNVARPDGGAAALRCPTCGAPLAPSAESPLAACDHCHGVSVVPVGVMARLAPRRVDLKLIWLLFAALALTVLGCGDDDHAARPDGGGALRDAAAVDAPPPRDAAGADVPARPDSGPEPPLVRSTDFAEDGADVLNPDRGLYWWDWNESASLVLVKGQLGEHCATATLPAGVIDALRARLSGHRDAGRRVILRFVYADDGVLNPCGLADAESIEIVEGHVAQLSAVIREHGDVIAYVEAGFFGMWGEWNSEHAPAGTSLWTSEDNRRRLLRALLDTVPVERAILVRRPRFRDELGFPAADLARIGFHNDCFLASDDDAGTYDGARSIAEWKTYVRDATTVVPLGGETCADTALYTACDHATTEMESLRFGYLHEGYHPDVIARWDREGCLPEVRRRLGYRLVVRAVEAPEEVRAGGVLRVRVELDNVGYAPPYSTRRLRLVLRNAAAMHVIEPFGAERADSRAWVPGTTHHIELAGALPADLAAGPWEVRLLLLEDLGDAPAYALLFANDARVRDDVRRENILARLTAAP